MAAILVSSGCSGTADDGTVRGELAVAIATRDDGTADRQYSLQMDTGEEKRLVFERDPELAAGDWLEVRGFEAARSIRVESFQRVAPPADLGQARSALVGAPMEPVRKMALVLVDTGGGLGTMTAEAAKTRLLGNGDLSDPNNTSLARYYDQDSYHIQTLTGDVIGPLKYDIADCDTSGMAKTLKAQIPGTYDQYGWYFAQTDVCDWRGLASEGTPDRPSRNTWFNGSLGCVVFAQEPGHNYGLQHSSAMACPGASFVDAPDGACAHSEYGDIYDPMGKGCYHMNMYQKQHQGWVGGCNSVKVTSDATFDIFPQELPCNAIQVLQVPMPKIRPFAHSGGGGRPAIDNLAYYYVEYRREAPFDKPGGTIFQGVQVHAADDYVPSTKVGRHTWLLDMKPSTNGSDLSVGATFSDPTGSPSITVVAADTNKATIKVTFQGGGSGSPQCVDGTMATPPGPQGCGSTGAAGSTGSGGAGGSGAGGADGAGGSPAGSGGGKDGTGGTGPDMANTGGFGGGLAGGMGTGGQGSAGKGGAGGVTGPAGGSGASSLDRADGSGAVTGGCSCSVAGDARGSSASKVWLAAGLLGSFAFRRRRRTRQGPALASAVSRAPSAPRRPAAGAPRTIAAPRAPGGPR